MDLECAKLDLLEMMLPEPSSLPSSAVPGIRFVKASTIYKKELEGG